MHIRCQGGRAERLQKWWSKSPRGDDGELTVDQKLNIPQLRAVKRDSVVKNDKNSAFESLLGVQARSHLLYKHATLPPPPFRGVCADVSGSRLFRLRRPTAAVEGLLIYPKTTTTLV